MTLPAPLSNILLSLIILGTTTASAALPAADYYSANYEEARGRFRQAATALDKAQVSKFSVPSSPESDLTVDYLYLPARQSTDRLLIVTSGVHGMEAFAGSAVQLLFLNEFGRKLEHQRTGYLLVHGLNPFGFKHHRRATEENVNLNRNFTTSPHLYQTENKAYPKLRSILEPQGTVESPFYNLLLTGFEIGSRILFGQSSLAELENAIGQGQYDSPGGLEYGGERQLPQVTDFLARLQRFSRPYSKVILIDLHTGLGEASQLHLMPGDVKGSVDPEVFAQLFHVDEDKDIYRYTVADDEGFYEIHGDMNNVLPEVLLPNQKAVGVTFEFGTIGNGFFPKLHTLNRLILENQGYHFGFLSPSVEQQVHGDFAELFFPQDPTWRQNVIEKSRLAFERILRRL